jgi:TRL (tRNA-associated locus)-like protein
MRKCLTPLALWALCGCAGESAFRSVQVMPKRPVFEQTARSPFGVVFQLTTRPLTINFDRTPVGVTRESGAGSVKQIQYRGLRVLWDDNALGSLAKEAGLEEIYYADVQTLSILNVYTQYKVRVYGRLPSTPEPAPAAP